MYKSDVKNCEMMINVLLLKIKIKPKDNFPSKFKCGLKVTFVEFENPSYTHESTIVKIFY